MERDFSDDSRQKMCRIVEDVKDDRWGGWLDRIGDFFLGLEEAMGNLNIDRYLNDVETYHRKIIDKNNVTERQINDIFREVYKVDTDYGRKMNGVVESMEQLNQVLLRLSQIIQPGADFSSAGIRGALTDSFARYEDAKNLVVNDLLAPEPVTESSVENAEMWKMLQVWNKKEQEKGKDEPVFGWKDVRDFLVDEAEIYVAQATRMPSFKSFRNSSGTHMVAISDSVNYAGGRGGVRAISEANLLRRQDGLGTAFRAEKAMKTAKGWLTAFDTAVTFYDEYQAGEGTEERERITNAAVETSTSVVTGMVGAKVGAAVGSIVPGAGTAIGAVVGLAAGTVFNIAADNAVHAKWFDDGENSAMDYLKKWVNEGVDYIGDAIRSFDINDVGDAFKNLGDTVAGWFPFA